MAEPTQEEMLAEQARFAGLPKLPQGVEVSERVRDLYDNLSAQADATPDGPDRDEIVGAMRALVDRAKDMVRAGEPDFTGNVVRRKEYTDKRGRLAVEEEDEFGHIRTSVTSKEETDRLQAEVRTIVDAKEDVDDIRAQATTRRRLAFDAEESGSSSAAEQLEQEATELDEKAAKKLETLRKVVPGEEWEEYGLGTYAPPLPGVQEGLDLVHAAKLDEAYEQLRGLGQAAMYDFMKRVPPEDRDHFEQLLEMESDDLTAQLRVYGRTTGGGSR